MYPLSTLARSARACCVSLRCLRKRRTRSPTPSLSITLSPQRLPRAGMPSLVRLSTPQAVEQATTILSVSLPAPLSGPVLQRLLLLAALSGRNQGGEPMGEAGGPTQSQPDQKSFAERAKTTVTRRDFLVGAGAGAATAVVVLGGAAVATKAINTSPSTSSTSTPTANLSPLPATMRRVELKIDGVTHNVVVDNRESIWETMNFQLGLSNSNLGCDRARCGACAILVDGKAVNGCTVLSARLGRGQEIKTVASLTTGPGVAGLH